jgi:hypothetical protein
LPALLDQGQAGTLEFGLVPAQHDHLQAVGQQRNADGTAHAARSAADEGYPFGRSFVMLDVFHGKSDQFAGT